MSISRLLAVILFGALAVPRSQGQDAAVSDSASAAPPPRALAKGSLLGDLLDPELKFAAGCGCYLKRSTAAGRSELVFFGKLGDQKGSGWIALESRVVEVPKEGPDFARVETGKIVQLKSYRSSEVAVRLELALPQVREETATYTGKLSVVAGGVTETVAVSGFCGC